jgi:hypothetical protein
MPTHRIRNRLLVLGALGVLALAVPASAADRFDDVPADATHGAGIGDVADAGITGGCASGRYCPWDDVSRAQMATFLSRTGSRADFASNTAELNTATGFDGVPASVTVRSVAAGDGENAVTLTGSVSVHSDGDVSTCPCEVEAFIFADDGNDATKGPSSWTQLPAETNSNGRVAASVPIQWMHTIPGGGEETYRVAVFLNGVEGGSGPTGVRAEASLSAVLAPFSE